MMENYKSKYYRYITHPFSIVFIIMLLMISGNCLAQKDSKLPPNVLITNAAWTEFNGERYEQAISNAEKCIDDFLPTAERQHRELIDKGEALPPEGKITDKSIRGKLLARGLVNDVAACWFIKGRSLEKLKKDQKAIAAYCETAKYTYARIYDPGWDGFWSPAKAAIDRALSLGTDCKKINTTH